MYNNHWSTKKTPHSEVWSKINELKSQSSSIRHKMLEFMRLYGDMQIAAPGSSYFGWTNIMSGGWNNHLSYNVVAMTTDSLTAKIGRQKPKPKFVPSGGTVETKTKCELLNKYTHGQFLANDVYEKARMVFNDACVFGTGILKVCAVNNKIHVERTFPLEIFVGNIDGMHMSPREIHQVKPYNKEVLKNMFPSAAHAIESSSGSKMFGLSGGAEFTDVIEVAESWTLPVGDKPGKHVICIANHTLIEEDYNEESFPFVFFRYKNRKLGFWGVGLAEALEGIQIEILDVLERIQSSMRYLGRPWLMLPYNTKTGERAPEPLANLPVNVLSFNPATGAPSVVHPQPVDPTLLQLLQEYYNKAFDITGLSQLSATSRKPEGLNSGVAIREYHDVESARFSEIATNWEDFFLRVSRLITDTAKLLAAAGHPQPVKAKQHKDFFMLDWKDIDLDRDKFNIEMFPTNLLPGTPEGRLAKVQEMLNTKNPLISPQEAMELLQVPDLERFESLALANTRAIKKLLEEVLEKGKDFTPEPFDDLQFITDYSIKLYNEARQKEDFYPEENMEKLINVINNTQAKMEELAQNQQRKMAEAQAKAAAPLNNPVAPPVGSPLDPKNL